MRVQLGVTSTSAACIVTTLAPSENRTTVTTRALTVLVFLHLPCKRKEFVLVVGLRDGLDLRQTSNVTSQSWHFHTATSQDVPESVREQKFCNAGAFLPARHNVSRQHVMAIYQSRGASAEGSPALGIHSDHSRRTTIRPEIKLYVRHPNVFLTLIVGFWKIFPSH